MMQRSQSVLKILACQQQDLVMKSSRGDRLAVSMEWVKGNLYEEVVQVCEEHFDTLLLSSFMQQQEAIVGGRDKRRNGLILVTVDHFEVHVFRLPHLFVDHVKTAVEHELFDDGVHAGVRLRET